MPDVSSKKFASVFAKALADSGRLSPTDLRELKAAEGKIADPRERAAAKSIMALLEHDAELDAFEKAPVRKALGVLIGVSKGPLPADLEKVLKHAVPAANVSVKHYDLTFDLAGKGPKFPARAILSLDTPGTRDTILEVNPDRLAIAQVLADGKPTKFEVRDGRLHAAAPGAKQLQVDYTVTPDDTVTEDSFGLIRDKYTGRMWTMTWPYNTGALFPSTSNPADGATSSVVVKVQQGMEAHGTGNEKNGAFVTGAEAPAYAIAFYAARDFELGNVGQSKDGVNVTAIGKGHEVSPAARKAYAAAAKDALDFFTGWLGKYDYGKTLKLVEVDGGLGGMEHTAAVAIMMNAAKDPEAAKETAVHETAHHWFGDNVRIAHWGDFWMSEGFTNYATFRWYRHAEGEGKFAALLSDAKDQVRMALKDNPHALSAPAYTDVNEIFDMVPYQMGPWILRMMEVELGTKTFDGLMRDWFQGHRQKAVSTEQFITFAKVKTGHDFKPFFDRWNSITQVPRFDPQLKTEGSSVQAMLVPKTEFPKGITVPLVLEGAGGQKKTVQVEPGKPLKLDAGFPVKKATWDPDTTVLAYIR